MRVLSTQLAVSSGSACTSAVPEPSYVLRALGRSEELAAAAIRLAVGRPSTADEVKQAIDIIRKDKKMEKYDLSVAADKKNFLAKYGEPPVAPPPPPPVEPPPPPKPPKKA